MYEEYWKLKEKPFENNFDLRFLYLSVQHEEVITRLLFAIREKRHGAIVSGRYGSGKSLILSYFIAKIREKDSKVRVIHIPDPMMTMAEFFREFFRQFGPEIENIPPDPAHISSPHMISTLQTTLTGIHDEGGQTVLVIDEATLIPADTLEELRLLLDLCHPQTHKALLSMILSGPFGEEDAPEHLRSPALRQRLPMRCHLELLDVEQCGEYIHHRLTVAGQPNQLFTDEAIQLIAERSGGAPRSINNICDLALFLGYSWTAVKIDHEIIGQVTAEIAESLI